jgi:OOP family OmpA-OmpF porin
MPRFDLDYVKISDYSNSRVNNLFKSSINGIYEFENKTLWTPYILGGVGYEIVSREVKDIFESHPFVQGGLGVNYKFKQGFKAEVEGKMLQIIGGNNENNELILNFGMRFPFLKKRENIVKPKKKKKVKRVVVVRRVVTPPPTPKPIIKIIKDNKYKCPKKISAPDQDRDGVADRFDQCPNTPCNFSVDNYGCPIRATLEIHFDVNSAHIKEYSIPKIERFAQFLLRNRGSRVIIVGHTDSDGSSDKNLVLSRRRAIAVADKLVELGVSPARITAIGKGESMPIASNSTEEGKRRNRRIEAVLVYPKH